MFDADKCALILIDIQGKLADVMTDKETTFNNIEKLIKGAQTLEVPIIWVEQIPEKMGPTIGQLSTHLSDLTPIAKTAFSCFGDDVFKEKLSSLGVNQTILVGIESHVCVYQTAADLVAAKYEVQVVADAVSSRTADNRQIGINRMRSLGAEIASTEMILFELLRKSDNPKFRDIARLIK